MDAITYPIKVKLNHVSERAPWSQLQLDLSECDAFYVILPTQWENNHKMPWILSNIYVEVKILAYPENIAPKCAKYRALPLEYACVMHYKRW